MPDTGINWEATFTQEFSGTLTQGGTDADTSDVISMEGKAAVEITIDADYSNHAKAGAGLMVYILGIINDSGDYEAEADLPWGFEMAFAQNGTRRKRFTLLGTDYSKFKIFLDWDNTTGSSSVTVVTNYKFATVPPAS